MKKNGFTLVELLVVISIIAILSVIGITIFSSAQKSARDAKRRSDLKAIANALEQYKTANGNYPQIAQSGGASAWFCDSYGNFADNTEIITALGPYFAAGIPKDPINDSTYRYKLDMIKDRNQYWLYATLETPPQVLQTIYGPGNPNGNACQGTIQVHLLITNQQ